MDQYADDIEPPKPVPAGDYVGMVVGHAEPGEASTGTKFWTHVIQLLEPLDSSKSFTAALEQALTKPDGTVQSLRDKTIQTRFFDTDAAGYRYVKFLGDLGIDFKDEHGRKKRVSEIQEETPGRQVIVTIKHTVSTRGDGMVFAEVTSTAPYNSR